MSRKFKEVMDFFDSKLGVGDGAEDWEKCKEYVGKYGLEYEVFELAYESIAPERASEKTCIAAISHQMDEWDL